MAAVKSKPTIVLVHGAFADGSSWNAVIELLQRQGFEVVAPAVPLRGVLVDSEYVAAVVGQIDGPVLLVGHSYGGAVISNMGSDAKNAIGLVFVAAFAPDKDERLGEVTPTSKDAILGQALVQKTYPGGHGESAVEFVIDPAQFRAAFCADLPEAQAAVMAANQRPIAATAFSDASGPPAWGALPSWAVVGTADKAAGADLVRRMAQRAGAQIVEVDSSHVVMVSQPQAVADVIVRAAESAAAARS